MITGEYKKQVNWLIYKTERLVSALYLVTDLINVNDPLKWQMRKTSIVLLAEISKLGELAPTDRDKVLRSVGETLTEILSLLEVAANAGLVSMMNYSLLKKEFTVVPTLLERLGKSGTMKSKGQITPTSIGHSIGQPKIIKDRVLLSPIGQNSIMENKVRKDVRKSHIIKAFDSGKSLSVSEVSELFRDFGTKMIQRDLIDLVRDGVLKKKGNKRWSRYFLAKL